MLTKAPPPPGCQRPSKESQGGFADFIGVVNAIIAKSKKAEG
jgi:hypothetical protein